MFLASPLLALLALLAVSGLADLGPVPTGTVRVYLVRHGQAYSNLDPEPDLPPEKLDSLTDLGHSQSRTTAAALRGRGIGAILSSPAGRAKETAEDLRGVLSTPPVRVETRLRPLDLGRKADGAALDWDERIALWDAGQDPSPPGGESLEQVGQRVLDLIQESARARPGSIVLVAHGEVIGSFLGLLNGTAPPKRYPPDVRNASIAVVDVVAGRRPTLLFSNVVPGETPTKP
jgi:ribonuclease H / adenosylcobalamin/alpha-ribazole phosphatase